MKKNGKKIGSDLKKAAAHVIQPHEYDELPMLTDEAFARGQWYRNGKPVARSRKVAKVSVQLQLDPEIMASFKATGAGWQSRINAVLLNHLPS